MVQLERSWRLVIILKLALGAALREVGPERWGFVGISFIVLTWRARIGPSCASTREDAGEMRQ